MNIQQAHNISVLMCNVVRDVLIPHYLKNYDHSIKLRVGSGRATYHSYKKTRTGSQYSITFGKKMIMDSSSSLNRASKWLHGKEILKNKYFDGDLNIKTINVHAVIHEFAHHLQCIRGGRYYRSVHNDFFYNILNEMYADNIHEKVMKYMNNDKTFQEIQFGKESKEVVIPKNSVRKEDIKVENIIEFINRNGEKNKGVVLKKNPKRALMHSLIDNKEYTVPYSIISKCYEDKETAIIITNKKEKFKSSYKKDQIIKFNFRNRVIEAKIIRCNPKTVSVENIHNKIQTFKVPYNIIK